MANSAFIQRVVPCDEIKVTATITHSSDFLSNGKITLNYQDAGKANLYKAFIQCVGCEKHHESTNEGFQNLKAGYYDIYIIDKKGCSKQLNVQVK